MNAGTLSFDEEELAREMLMILLPRLFRGKCWWKVDPLEFQRVGFHLEDHLKPNPVDILQ